jgi:PAS domain S-box-containing protein
MQLTHALKGSAPSRQETFLRRWSTYFAIFVLTIALLALAGRAVEPLRRSLPLLKAMNSLTALNFLFAGMSFLLLSPNPPFPLSLASLAVRRITIGWILAGIVFLIGVLTAAGQVPGLHQPADLSAFCFILLAGSLFLLHRTTKHGHQPSQLIALLIAWISLFSLIGYLYRVQHPLMAVQAAACFLFLALAVLLAHPCRGIMKELTGVDKGSAAARLVLLLVILLPILLGYLRLLTYWKGYTPSELGATLMVSVIIFVFSNIAWLTARLLKRGDQKKKLAELQLRETEHRFELLVGSVGDYAIFMLDPSGRVMSWNEGAERIKGYKREEILGRDLSIFYTPAAVERGDPHFNLSQARMYGRYEGEGERVRKDGSVFWANVVFTALHDLNGELIGFAKVTRDITEKKRSEEQITYMARLMEDTTDAIFSTDASFVIRSWNKAAELLYGYTLAEVRGRMARAILRTQMGEEMIRDIREKMNRTGYWKGEVLYLTKGGTPLTILLSASSVNNAEGKPDGFVMVCRDFTERKKLELQLEQFNRELEVQVQIKTAELTGIFERITDAFIALDKNLCYTYLNKKAGELIQRDPASLIGQYVWDIFPDAIGSETWLAFNEAMAEQRYITNTDYYPPLDLWQENHLYPSPDGLSVFIRDISEKKKREKEVTDYKYALDQSSIVSITDEKGVIKYVNDNFCRISGFAAAELIGSSHRVVGTEQHPQEFFRTMWQTISKGEVWKGETRNRTKNGAIYWVDMTIIPFLNAKGEPYEYMALDSDITERKKAEEMLGQSYQDIRQLASHLQDIREEERAGIAREIHDELGQQLTGLKMDLSWMNKRKVVQEDRELGQKAIDTMRLLDTTIMTVRRIATDLRPSILDDLGLVAAIEWQCHEFGRRSGIRTEFTSTVTDFLFSSRIAIGLFRICQESLTNVARHAAASRVRISLQEVININLLLKVEDDGKGFDVRTRGGKKTLGLLGMKERALMMGGELKIESEPGKGTALFVTVPITTI